MTRIYFITTAGTDAFLQDETFRVYVEFHHWQPDDGSYIFGYCNPRGISPQLVADKLESFGATVLPGLNHPAPPALPKHVVDKLGKHGVKATDKTADVAEKIAAVAGHPGLKPHYF